jgi:hypothetical protein
VVSVVRAGNVGQHASLCARVCRLRSQHVEGWRGARPVQGEHGHHDEGRSTDSHPIRGESHAANFCQSLPITLSFWLSDCVLTMVRQRNGQFAASVLCQNFLDKC